MKSYLVTGDFDIHYIIPTVCMAWVYRLQKLLPIRANDINYYFNDFLCTANQINAINVFISNNVDIIQLLTLNMVARDSDNIHCIICCRW